MVCLDTSIVIAFLKGDKEVTDLVQNYEGKGGLSITTITEYELLRYSQILGMDKLVRLFETTLSYSFDRTSAKIAAEIYKSLKTKGKMVNENDVLIAAISMSNKEVLFTKDKKFAHIEGLDSRII